MTRIDEIAPDVFRISTYVEAAGLQFNQFLLRDDAPLLYHAGQNALFDPVLQAVRSLIDVRDLHWIGFSHFEADECGALNRWLRVAPRAQPLTGVVAATTCINDYAERAPQVLADGAVLHTGRHTLRWLATPHLPHNWEASLLHDETGQVLFCSDLLLQRGRTPARSGDVLGPAVAALEQGQQGPLHDATPWTHHTPLQIERLAALAPRTLAIMHGASAEGDGAALLRDYGRALERVLGPGASA